MEKRSFSFEKGLGLIRKKDLPKVRKELMSALGIKTRVGWRNRRIGLVEPKISEAMAIVAIFKKYGVTEIWGHESEGDINEKRNPDSGAAGLGSN